MGAFGVTAAIRMATPDDLARLATLSRTTQTEHASRLPDIFDAEDTPVSVDAYSNIVKGKIDGAVLVAESDGQIVGHAGFYLMPMPATTDRHHITATVLDVSIAEGYRGQGIGRQLLDKLKSAAKDRGATDMRAQVWRGNTVSEALFDKVGFDRVFTEFRQQFEPSRAGAFDKVRNRRPTLLSWLWLVIGALVVIGMFASR